MTAAPTATAPRCEGSDAIRTVEGTIPDPYVEQGDVSRWAYGTHTTCPTCQHSVQFRVRATDLPPWARILPHRTDGTPTR